MAFREIKDWYNGGDFDKIRVKLEDFLKEKAKTALPNEKVFAYKYLGVVYAASPQGANVAETYFYQMLKLSPNAHLSDLHVSTSIENLFEKTRERIAKENRDISKFDEFGNPVAESEMPAMALPRESGNLNKGGGEKRPQPLVPKQAKVETEKKSKAWLWVVGVGTAGAIGGYYLYSSQADAEKKPPNVVDGGSPD